MMSPKSIVILIITTCLREFLRVEIWGNLEVNYVIAIDME